MFDFFFLSIKDLVLKDLCSCSVAKLCSTLCDPKDCSPPGFLYPWNFPDNNTGEGCYSHFQRNFPTQESNLCLLYWQADLLSLSHLGSPTKDLSYFKNQNMYILKYVCARMLSRFHHIQLFVTLGM